MPSWASSARAFIAITAFVSNVPNTATAVVAPPQPDPDTTNTSATLDVDPVPADDTIFADGFDG